MADERPALTISSFQDAKASLYDEDARNSREGVSPIP
jgi:hypothetical protein